MTTPRVFRALLLCSALLISVPLPALAQPAPAQYTAEGAGHFVGQPTRVSAPSDTLIVTYRPSTSLTRVDTLVGAQQWTPTEAGVVTLSTPGGETQNVSVRFRETPVSGLFVLLGAGLILFGGAGYAFRKLFEDDAPPVT